MAVKGGSSSKSAGSPGSDFQGRHLVIGANVAISVAVALAIVVVVQWGAYRRSGKIDLTDQGVNSISPGTERLISDLSEKIRLTSLYFETDLEGDDQARYRTKMNDLLGLLQGVNRTMVETDHFNPLQDHAKREKFLKRLRNLEKFRAQTVPYEAFIERYRADVAGPLGELLQSELDEIATLTNASPHESERDHLGQIQAVLERWQRELGLIVRDIDDALGGPQPRYGTAQGLVSGLARNLTRDLRSVATYAQQRLDQPGDRSPEVATYFAAVADRYRDVIADLESLSADASDLPDLEFEQLARQIGPTSNALVVETEKDAKVLNFNELWPPANPNTPPSAAGFAERLFKGEKKIEAAVLQLTQTEQTAVVFVRFAGPPLFFGMPGSQQPPPYAQLKELLEDVNFTVHDWDIAASDTPPEIDPPPIKTLYVVMRPMAPQQNIMQMQQQPHPPQFGPEHERMLLDAMGDEPRAIFFAGWAPGPFGAFPDPYPLNDYLSDNWGLHVTSDRLLLGALMGEKAGQYMLAQRSLFVSEFSRSEHILVSGMLGQPASFSYVAPLEIASESPEGVTTHRLLWCDKRDGLWGVKNVQTYVEQARRMKGIQKDPDDLEGPFNLAAAAEKGDGKIVVVGSRSWMMDAIAMAPVMVLTSQGISMRQSNPGNVHLFLNTLHWLNDKTEWMDVGKPVNTGTIEIEEGPALSFVRAFVYCVWPATALLCGGGVWWIRRR